MADVICPNCGERYHQTTEAYLPGVTTTGNMLKLKPLYADNGWSSFPEHEGMMHGSLECPGCGGCYSSDGQVRIDMDQFTREQFVIHSTKWDRIEKISQYQEDVTEIIKQSRSCINVTDKKKPGRPKKI